MRKQEFIQDVRNNVVWIGELDRILEEEGEESLKEWLVNNEQYSKEDALLIISVVKG